MTTFCSWHLFINRNLADDRRHLYDFIDADYFVGVVLLLHPQTLTFFLTITLILGKR